MDPAKAVYRLTAGFPAEERFGLARQLQRAAVSIASNIAEGNARQSTAEYARFVSVASGSMAELITQSQLAAELGSAKESQAEPVQELAESVGGMLYRLHQALLERMKIRSPVPGPRSPSSLLKNALRGRFSRRPSGAGPDGLTANQRLAPSLRRAAIQGRYPQAVFQQPASPASTKGD